MFDIVQLTKAYTEPHRHYHTLEHITNMFMVASEYNVALTTSQTLAIWWHDFVYDPKSKTNEADSADYMMAYIGKHYRPIFTVKRIILDTITHVSSFDESKVVLDLDLCGLGSDWDTFQHNTNMIRKEFSHLSNVEWMQGRLNWISAFVTRPRIFYTDWAHEAFDEAARSNLTNEYLGIQETLASPLKEST
jgi:predicted metal-dependent HD superfamily phosphohydrolase